jgi:uncharacterized protein
VYVSWLTVRLYQQSLSPPVAQKLSRWYFSGAMKGRHQRRAVPVTLTELQKQRDEIARLADQCGARRMRVFGSVARGEAGPASDVDFLAEFDPGGSLVDLARLELALAALIGREVHFVDLPEISEMAPYERTVALRIQAEAVSL